MKIHPKSYYGRNGGLSNRSLEAPKLGQPGRVHDFEHAGVFVLPCDVADVVLTLCGKVMISEVRFTRFLQHRYQNGKNIPNDQCILKGHKLYQRDINYTKGT
jgi:hypothetical protein